MRDALALRELKPEWLDRPKETAELGLTKVELEALEGALTESLHRAPANKPRAGEKP